MQYTCFDLEIVFSRFVFFHCVSSFQTFSEEPEEVETGLIIGVTVGVVVILIIAIIVAVVMVRMRRRR